MVHLAIIMHCNRPTDHAIDHSSIGLKRLTIQLVFNEVSLFTFSNGTHGFYVTVPKNYLKFRLYLMDYSHCTKTGPGQVQGMGPGTMGPNIYLLYRNVHAVL